MKYINYNFSLPIKLDLTVTQNAIKLDMSKGEVVRRSIATYLYFQEFMDKGGYGDSLQIGDRTLVFSERR